MVKAYNSDHNDKILLDQILNKTNNTQYHLWKAINNKLKNKCDDETCWTTQPFVNNLDDKTKNFVENLTFKPTRPLDPSGNHKGVWLSNFDIDYVMRQYEHIYSDFKFLGPYPIDWIKYNFYKFTPHVIKNLLAKKMNRIGIIFNTGTLESGGKHWVAMFLNFRDKVSLKEGNGELKVGKYTIEYFDSVGTKPPAQIETIIDQIHDACCAPDKCMLAHKYVNQLAHQKGTSECGVYCLYFISERLKGRSYVDIQSQLTHDDVMEAYRSKFFRWE